MPSTHVTATYFKAHCLRLLDEVAESGDSLIVTKHGKPVARVGPPDAAADLLGSATIHLTDDELVHASMGPWEVESA